MHFQNEYQIGTRFREMGAEPHAHPQASARSQTFFNLLRSRNVGNLLNMPLPRKE